mgnify:CR=1 FL=1
MLEQVCDFVHNYFILDEYDGTYEIADGTVSLPFLIEGQRFKIKGSALNDGIYTYHTNGTIYDDDNSDSVYLLSESFNGTICAMGVPRSFEKITQAIAAWQEANEAVLESPYTSESFGGYSYTKASGSGSNAGGSLGWQDMFGSRLKAYRKIS